MQFKIITNQVLRECLSNLLMNNYSKSYDEFRKLVKLEISKEQFEEYKTKEITSEEMAEILNKKEIDTKDEAERIRDIWNEKEKEIIVIISKITGIKIDTENIICYSLF